MHRALLILDILREVFAHLDDPVGDSREAKENRRALSQAARTCRAFFLPSVEALWRKPSSIFPLLSLFECLETTVIPEYSLSVAKSRLRLAGEITPAEWERFRFYASFVHSITVDVSDDSIDPSVFEVLATRVADAPLLPALTNVNWIQPSSLDLRGSGLESILTDTLRSVSLSMTHSSVLKHPTHITELTQNRSVDFSTLSNLHRLKLLWVPSSVASVLVASVQSLRQLSISYLTAMDNVVLSAMSRMAQLERLELRLERERTKQELGCYLFCELRQLYLAGPSATLLETLRAMVAPHLQFLSLRKTYGLGASPTEFPSLLSHISASLARSLRHFTASTYMISRQGLAVLLPLTKVRGLEELNIGMLSPGHHSMSLTSDDIMEEMARAWPRLTVLTINSSTTSCSTRCLIHFARYCPQLKQLALPLHDDGTLTIDCIGEDVPLHRSLRRFDLYGVSLMIQDIPAPLKLAAAVYRLFSDIDVDLTFSNLRRLCPWYDNHHGWGIVLEALKHLQRINATNFN